MFRRVADFLKCWDEERKGTLKLLAALDDRSLSQAAAGDQRTLGRVAWHITATLAEMLERLGLKLAGPAHDAPVPRSAAEIVRAYDAASRSVAELVAS